MFSEEQATGTTRQSFGDGCPFRTRSNRGRLAETPYLAQQYRGQCPVFRNTFRSNAYTVHTSPRRC